MKAKLRFLKSSTGPDTSKVSWFSKITTKVNWFLHVSWLQISNPCHYRNTNFDLGRHNGVERNLKYLKLVKTNFSSVLNCSQALFIPQNFPFSPTLFLHTHSSPGTFRMHGIFNSSAAWNPELVTKSATTTSKGPSSRRKSRSSFVLSTPSGTLQVFVGNWCLRFIKLRVILVQGWMIQDIWDDLFGLFFPRLQDLESLC